jgi:hypothetical protein
LLLLSTPAAHAQKRDGKWGCFRYEVRYSTTQLYQERCAQVYSGNYGDGIFCYTVTMDFGTFCQMEGGACYYVVVEGANRPVRQESSASSTTSSAVKALHIF